MSGGGVWARGREKGRRLGPDLAQPRGDVLFYLFLFLFYFLFLNLFFL
jgi:hypothetical protein